MSAEEKILAGITAQAEAKAEEILGEATKRINEINESAISESKSYSGEVVSAALRRAKTLKENAESASELLIRDAKLAKKLEEIEKTISAAKKAIIGLPDNVYFQRLAAMAKAEAREEQAMLYLGAADIKRDVACFKAALDAAGVNALLQSEPAPFDNGLVLKYGDIEYNMSLESVIAEKRELLEDRVNSILFAD